MNKQQKLKIALPMLVVIMAFVWGPVIIGSGSKRKADKGNSAGNSQGMQQASGNSIDLTALSRVGRRQKTRTSYADWGRNPFVLKQVIKALAVEGILWDENDPKAIINGNIVGIGDQVGSSIIIDIKPSSVTIKGDMGETILNL